MIKGSKKNKPLSYTGPLTPRQAAGGINRAIANARLLTADAELLLAHGRWPTAASLAVLALEEVGKLSVLRAVAMAATREDIATAWRPYTQHVSKVGMPIGINPDGVPLIDMDAMHEAIAGHQENAWKLVHLREAGFYTDCRPRPDVGGPQWQTPAGTVGEYVARLVVSFATDTMRSRPDVTVREIELAVEHLAPTIGKSEAVQSWQDYMAAMETEGLLNEPREVIEQRFFAMIFGRDWGTWKPK